MKKRIIAAGAAMAAASLVLTGCAGGVNPQDVKVDFGVTEDTITIGALSDVSKIYTATAPSHLAGIQIYFDERNANGGICERKVDTTSTIKDHQSDNTLATTLFQEIEPNVLAIAPLLGSPQQAALKEAVTAADITAILAGWSSMALDNPNYVLAGTTYPLDIINGLSWLQDEKKIAKGQTLGYINVPGDFGANARSGGEYFATQNGYTLKGIEITGKETDLAAQVDQVKAAGATALVVSAGPKSVGQAVAAVKAAGLNIPVLVNTPGYSPTFVGADAKTADFMQSNVFITTSLLPYGDENETTKKVKAAFEKGQADGTFGKNVLAEANLNYGYAMGAILGQTLDAACKSGDLTRAGVQAALATLSKVETGVSVNLDYTDRTKSPSTESYILQPDAKASGTTKLVAKTGTSATAEQFNAQK